MWQATNRAFVRIASVQGVRLALTLKAQHSDFPHFKSSASLALGALAPEEDMTGIDWVRLRDLLRREANDDQAPAT